MQVSNWLKSHLFLLTSKFSINWNKMKGLSKYFFMRKKYFGFKFSTCVPCHNMYQWSPWLLWNDCYHGNHLVIWLLLFKQKRMQFKPIKRRLLLNGWPRIIAETMATATKLIGGQSSLSKVNILGTVCVFV